MIRSSAMTSSCRSRDRAPTQIYTLSLHDALPISGCDAKGAGIAAACEAASVAASGCVDCGWSLPSEDAPGLDALDRKSTRLNSSHEWISYAVFCLKKKNNKDYRLRLKDL